jgi:predicted oxidoreductase
VGAKSGCGCNGEDAKGDFPSALPMRGDKLGRATGDSDEAVVVAWRRSPTGMDRLVGMHKTERLADMVKRLWAN